MYLNIEKNETKVNGLLFSPRLLELAYFPSGVSPYINGFWRFSFPKVPIRRFIPPIGDATRGCSAQGKAWRPGMARGAEAPQIPLPRIGGRRSAETHIRLAFLMN